MFKVGDKVRVQGSGVVGEITSLEDERAWTRGKVCVTRPHPTKKGVKTTQWVKVEKVTHDLR